MKEIDITAVVENLQTVLDFVDEQLEAKDCPLKIKMQIDMAVEEIFVNISNYAYFPDVGPATVRVSISDQPPMVDITFIDNGVPDDIFKRIVAVLRIAVPYTGMIMSTRESAKTRRECLEIGITQISGGSRTSVGGYGDELDEQGGFESEGTAQFDVEDRRTLAEVVDWLIDLGYVPSFCTACYREGRTGDRFMSLLKSGQIANCCQPNAMMTLKEFLMDYAGEETRAKGDALIEEKLSLIPNEKVREICRQRLAAIEAGERDFRF